MGNNKVRSRLRGLIAVSVTPFKKDLSLDEEGVRSVASFLVESGMDAIVPCGSMGEWNSLTDDEVGRIIEITVDVVNGRIPVIAGVSSTSSIVAARRAKMAEDMGADALLVLPAFYSKYNFQGILRHFELVASSTDLGIIVYNFPDALGYEIPTVDLEELVERIPSIVGLKDSTTDMAEFSFRLNRLGDKIAVLLGNEPYCFHGLVAGSPGAFTSMANFNPRVMRMLYTSIVEGRIERARRIYRAMSSYFEMRRRLRRPAALVKQAMVISGHKIEPTVRPPLIELDEKEKEALRKIVADLEELGTEQH
jgi:4-hydroxy-tetrahydrodipicolinate synthase